MKQYTWDDISPTVGTLGPFYLASDVEEAHALLKDIVAGWNKATEPLPESLCGPILRAEAFLSRPTEPQP